VVSLFDEPADNWSDQHSFTLVFVVVRGQWFFLMHSDFTVMEFTGTLEAYIHSWRCLPGEKMWAGPEREVTCPAIDG
jgi:hypothetical protein